MNIRSIVLALVTITASLAVMQFALRPFVGYAAAPEERPAPAFENIDRWLNSEPLKIEDLRGKVVLIDFWTYTCINCLNHLPYVQEWPEKYKDKGLVVVGVHTPEFGFEKSTKNVEAAIKRLQIRHAVAQDNSYARRASSVCAMPALAKRALQVPVLSSIASRPLPAGRSERAVSIRLGVTLAAMSSSGSPAGPVHAG